MRAALLALLFALVADREQDGPAARAKTLWRELGTPARAAEAREELADLFTWTREEVERDEADAEVLEAYVVAGLLLSSLGAEDLGTGAERRAELERIGTVAEELGQPVNVAWARHDLATELVSAGRLQEAESLLEAVLDGQPRVDHAVSACFLLAEVCRRDTRLLPALERQAELEERIGDLTRSGWPEAVVATWRARLHGSRGQTYQQLGLLALASREHAREEEEAQRSGDPTARVAALLDRADLALLTEDFTAVVADLEALPDSPLANALSPAQLAQSRVYLGIALAELERTDRTRESRAADLLAEALDRAELPVSEALVARRYRVDLALLAGSLEEARGELSALETLLGRAESEHSLESALATTFAARLALASGAPRAELETHLVRVRAGWERLLARWRDTPLRPGGIGFLVNADRREVASTLVRLTLALERPVDEALDALLEAEALGTLARRAELTAVTTAAVRAGFLVDGQGVLLLLPARDRSHLFALDRERTTHYELERWDVLKLPAQEFQSLLLRDPRSLSSGTGGKRHLARLERLQGELSELLLPPAVVARIAGWRRLTVLGANLLAQVPFEALRTEAGWLGTTHAVDQLPSLALGLYLVARREARKPSAAEHDLVLVPALRPSDYARERWNDLDARSVPTRDVERLTDPFAERTRVLDEDDAVEEELLALDLRGVPVVHFLVHGAQLSDRERGAALALPGGADASTLLTCEDVERALRIDGLVILSACGVGRGPARPGDDNVAHLGGAFLNAGAHTVVTSRALLLYAETLELMETVHVRLAAGATPAEALRAARAGVPEENLSARFHAATLQVLGLGQRGLVPALTRSGEAR